MAPPAKRALASETYPSRFDYDKEAHRYDRHRKVGGPFIAPLVQLAQASRARRVLEIGPGTGNNTRAFHEAHPCALIGLDRSRGMLEAAHAKDLDAAWIQADATRLPLADATFDFIFGVLVLHHLPDVRPLFQESRRVLRRGHAAFVTSPHGFIDNHPINRYFPSFARIDKARFQSVEALWDAMRSAGFSQVGAEHTKAPPEPIDARYVEKVAGKFISTYTYIPDPEFQEGLARLRDDVAQNGSLDTPVEWESVTVWGRAE